MLCTQCGGRLKGNLTICPFCRTRQDIDLSQVHFRPIPATESLPCPGCRATLEVLECDTEPPLQIERCPDCRGLFFNPGELEALLHAKSPEVTWVDPQRLREVAENFRTDVEVTYRPCPHCGDRMSRVNFGERSGVIIDRCWTHGVYLDAGELRHLLEWWRAGGKQIHQQVKPRIACQPARATGGKTLSGIPARELSDSADKVTNTFWGVEILAGILSSIVD